MYARDKTSRAVPCWLIFDDRYRKRYAHQRSHPGHFPKKLLESGNLKQAWTLADLASMCGIDPAGLAATVERFNEHAAQRRRPRLRAGRVGLQPVARRPATARCTRASARSTRRPYYAVRDAARRHRHLRRPGHRRARPRARRARAQPIDGLYATGNSTATVMGRHYLGPGASIANSMVFGYLAARQVAARSGRAGGRQCNVTPSRRTVIARVGQQARRRDQLRLVDRVDVDHRRDAVVVEVERTDGLVDAVARAHARVPVDVHFDGHAASRTTGPIRVRKHHAI